MTFIADGHPADIGMSHCSGDVVMVHIENVQTPKAVKERDEHQLVQLSRFFLLRLRFFVLSS
jgi:hypothetical protein